MLENVRLAVACGADPAMALAVAVASSGAGTPAQLFAMLDARRPEIEKIMSEPSDLKKPAPLEPGLSFEPELGRIRPDLQDHEVRGKLLFRDILGKRTFLQAAAFAIAGVELSAADAELLGDVGVVTMLMEPRIWPLTVARRVGARGGGLARSAVAGIAAVCTENMSAPPVGGFMRFLDRLEAETRAGKALEQAVDDILARRERILGIGRPAFGPDERVPRMHELHERYGRAGGPSVQLARRLDAHVEKRKGLRVNSAGFHGALMRDLGFSPTTASAFCLIYFLVPILANAVYPEAREKNAHG